METQILDLKKYEELSKTYEKLNDNLKLETKCY